MRHRVAAQIVAESTEAQAVPTEFYLIIFLLVAMLVFTYFYSERAQARRAGKRGAHDQNAEADANEA
jgi:hypothetical protein